MSRSTGEAGVVISRSGARALGGATGEAAGGGSLGACTGAAAALSGGVGAGTAPPQPITVASAERLAAKPALDRGIKGSIAGAGSARAR
jgi:hypothetical protein